MMVHEMRKIRQMRTSTFFVMIGFLLWTNGCTQTSPPNSNASNVPEAPVAAATSRPETIALLLAAREGKPDTIKTLIASGVNLNGRDAAGNTTLIEAARTGHEDIAKELIAFGADASLANNAGQSALMLAIEIRHYLQ